MEGEREREKRKRLRPWVSGSRTNLGPLSIFSSFLQRTLWGKLAFEGIELPLAKRLLLQKLEPGTQVAEALFKSQRGW